MERLYIVRHGIAVERGAAGIEDDERPLTPKGERRMMQVAKGLRRLRIAPDRLLSSPLPRAWRTAELLAEPLGLRERVERADELRVDRDAGAIRDWLAGLTGESIMIVGHNPSLSDLVGTLIGAEDRTAVELKKGGIASFVAAPGGGFLLDWLATPRLTRRLA